MTSPQTLWLSAGALLAAFFALGSPFARGFAATLDRSAAAWPSSVRTQPLAVAFTRSGYWPALVVLGTLAAIASLAAHAPLTAVWVVALQIVSQTAVALLKHLFSRVRPGDWLFRMEPGFSYPSGHATTAVVFYGGWSCALLFSTVPSALRVAGAVVLLAWAVGICWSRVSLRAHYPSDVVGGVLFGGAFLCAGLALADQWHLLQIGARVSGS